MGLLTKEDTVSCFWKLFGLKLVQRMNLGVENDIILHSLLLLYWNRMIYSLYFIEKSFWRIGKIQILRLDYHSSMFICQNWVLNESDILSFLFNQSLHCLVFFLCNLFQNEFFFNVVFEFLNLNEDKLNCLVFLNNLNGVEFVEFCHFRNVLTVFILRFRF